MAVVVRVIAVTMILLMTGCMSAEEQRRADIQTCAGYGFQPGSEAFATCMMTTAQQRSEQRAAAQRQQSLNDAIAAQAREDREAQASRDAASERQTQPSFGMPQLDSMGIPKIDVPTISAPTMPDLSSMHCSGTSASGDNAGSMNMSCSN